MAVDPWAIDSSGGAPAYSGQELRLGTLAPLLSGAGASLGVHSGVRLSGSGTDLLVAAQGTPNMSVVVNPGIAVVQGTIATAQGPYAYTLDTATTLTIAASHATLDRTDLVCVRIRDASVDSSGARDGSVVVVQGTNGGGVPAVPTGATYMVLAQVFVQHAVTSITGGAITDKRPFLAAVGGVMPFVSTARPTSLIDGQPGWETDTSLRYTYRAGSLNKWLRDRTDIYKPSGQNTSTTTMASDTALQFAAEANATYVFEMHLMLFGDAGTDLKPQMLVPAGASLTWTLSPSQTSSQTVLDSVTWHGTSTSTTPGWIIGLISSNHTYTHLVGSVATAGTAGTVALQYAVNVNTGLSSSVEVGSWMHYRQVG